MVREPYPYEAEFMQKNYQRQKNTKVKAFNLLIRYIDDVLSIQ